MRFLQKKDILIVVFFSIIVFLAFFRFTSLAYLMRLGRMQIETYNRRYTSYLLADELRQTSDDLTTMARLYVITGDEKYRKNFDTILKIRDGEVERPKNYHLIYWDLVDSSDAPRLFEDKKSLREMMIDQNFTIQEFNLLLKAKDASDDLADMEISAMNAYVGKYDDGTGQFTIVRQPDQELAKKLVFGKDYMKAKSEVMAPIQEFLKKVENRTKNETDALNRREHRALVLTIAISALAAALMIVAIIKTLFMLSKLNKENETLLLNVLPTPIANRLKMGEKIIADRYPQVSVLFADIVNFTAMTKELGPDKIVEILNGIFKRFDSITGLYKIEKIKTIGDNYMAVAGAPSADTNHAINLANFALAIRDLLNEYNKENDLDLQIRIGMSYGAVIAGVIGQKKFVYDLWGDGVNIASRMESTGEPGKIQVSEKLKMLLEEDFEFEGRAEIEVKGVGSMKTFFLLGKKAK